MSQFRNLFAILFSAFLALVLAPRAEAKDACYNPGQDPARHPVATLIPEAKLAAIVLREGMIVQTDSGSYEDLRAMPPLCADTVVLINTDDIVNGQISKGYISECHNRTTFPAQDYVLATVDVPEVDLSDWYRARSARDVQQTWLHMLVASADWCAGGILKTYAGNQEPKWLPNPAPPNVNLTRSSAEAARAILTTDFELERWSGLKSCPTPGLTDLVWDGKYNSDKTPACRKANSMAEDIIALYGEKIARFDNPAQFDAIETYLMVRGVQITGSINVTGSRTYVFPDVCPLPPAPPSVIEIERELDTAYLAKFKFRGTASFQFGGGQRIGGDADCDCDRKSPLGMGLLRVGFMAGGPDAAFELAGRAGGLFTGADIDLPGSIALGGDIGVKITPARAAGARISFVVQPGLDPAFAMRSLLIGAEAAVEIHPWRYQLRNPRLPGVTAWGSYGTNVYQQAMGGDTRVLRSDGTWLLGVGLETLF